MGVEQLLSLIDAKADAAVNDVLTKLQALEYVGLKVLHFLPVFEPDERELPLEFTARVNLHERKELVCEASH